MEGSRNHNQASKSSWILLAITSFIQLMFEIQNGMKWHAGKQQWRGMVGWGCQMDMHTYHNFLYFTTPVVVSNPILVLDPEITPYKISITVVYSCLNACWDSVMLLCKENEDLVKFLTCRYVFQEPLQRNEWLYRQTLSTSQGLSNCVIISKEYLMCTKL